MDPWVVKQNRRDMKKAREGYDSVSSIFDGVWGITDRFPCGGFIMNDVSPNPKYKRDFDTLSGSRYFTCIKYKEDGLHFCQPWVLGVQEEVRLLKNKVEFMANEIAKLKVETMVGEEVRQLNKKVEFMAMADDEVRQLKKKVEFMADDMAALKAWLAAAPSGP